MLKEISQNEYLWSPGGGACLVRTQGRGRSQGVAPQATHRRPTLPINVVDGCDGVSEEEHGSYLGSFHKGDGEDEELPV
jgi:hypothetical protein